MLYGLLQYLRLLLCSTPIPIVRFECEYLGLNALRDRTESLLPALVFVLIHLAENLFFSSEISRRLLKHRFEVREFPRGVNAVSSEFHVFLAEIRPRNI